MVDYYSKCLTEINKSDDNDFNSIPHNRVMPAQYLFLITNELQNFIC